MDKLQIGFDIGGTNIKAGIIKNEMEILARRKEAFPKNESYKTTVEILRNMVCEMTAELKFNIEQIKSIGVAIPGSIDDKGEVVVAAHNLNFYNVPLKSELQKKFPLIPITLVNDANAATLAELKCGALKNCRTGVLITLGTGVGGGIVLNGEMFMGGNGQGIELGHMVILHGGPTCTCGNKGCVESVCTGPWIEAQGRKALDERKDSLICKHAQDNREMIDAKMVIDSAKEGDYIAKEIFRQYVEHLSSAIVNITALLDPEIIALGGGISLAGDLLYKPLRKLVEEHSFHKYPYKIVPALLGNDAGIIGAAMWNEKVE